MTKKAVEDRGGRSNSMGAVEPEPSSRSPFLCRSGWSDTPDVCTSVSFSVNFRARCNECLLCSVPRCHRQLKIPQISPFEISPV
jgi:hypothetical protein